MAPPPMQPRRIVRGGSKPTQPRKEDAMWAAIILRSSLPTRCCLAADFAASGSKASRRRVTSSVRVGALAARMFSGEAVSVATASSRAVHVGSMIDVYDAHFLVVEAVDDPVGASTRSQRIAQLAPQRHADSSRVGCEVAVDELDYRYTGARCLGGKAVHVPRRSRGPANITHPEQSSAGAPHPLSAPLHLRCPSRHARVGSPPSLEDRG